MKILLLRAIFDFKFNPTCVALLFVTILLDWKCYFHTLFSSRMCITLQRAWLQQTDGDYHHFSNSMPLLQIKHGKITLVNLSLFYDFNNELWTYLNLILKRLVLSITYPDSLLSKKAHIYTIRRLKPFDKDPMIHKLF